MTTTHKSLQLVQSGHRLFIQGGVATPRKLLELLVAESHRLQNCELIHLHTMHPPIYAKPEYKGNFRVVNLFVGAKALIHIAHPEDQESLERTWFEEYRKP